ncbi:MAG TPA: hypothetical protein VGH62_02080 [Bradyrhizobium sp.]|jgi:hypothetical protein
MELGPEFFKLLKSRQWDRKRAPINFGAPGLSIGQIASIEAELGFRVPNDFAYLFRNLQDPGGLLFPWFNFDKRAYDESIEWVFRGLALGIERNYLWLKRWGNRPETNSAALDVARKDFETWPRLLPIFAHRFLVAEPCCDGNPVLSIMGADIIYYGADLPHYLLNEFVEQDYALHVNAQTIRRMEVWSDFAEGEIAVRIPRPSA